MMGLVSRGRSLWKYVLIFLSLQIWGSLSASTSTSSPPPPKLDIYLNLEDDVILVCRAPEGHYGLVFTLYQEREESLHSEEAEVQFTVRKRESKSDRRDLFCCLYKNRDGVYSGFSTYLELTHQTDPAPTLTSYPPPLLSVEPSTGLVKRGATLSFSCTVPAHALQSQSDSNQPVTFLLLRSVELTVGASTVPPPASLVSNSQPGIFTVSPVRGEEEGEYSCVYQISKRKRLVNSTVSNVVKVTVTDGLPLPTLVLQQQTDVLYLLCKGSAAYPGALFSLFLMHDDVPIVTQRSKVIEHQATFAIPVQDTPQALYQCQYSVQLGGKWSYSERSHYLAINRGSEIPTTTSQDVSGVDWPLVLGSFSAAVLFISSLALIVVIAHRKVKAASQEKKNREQAQFWTHVHSKDHVVDLTLSRTSVTSQEWSRENHESASRSPLWSSLSTFTSPIH
ncbi:uncharacterized protein LOC114468365 isoform X2 [Gouania willdenowi]|uniref:uncharacterized protein LOC114468365 isoform X2 n=1 Tax=Gouania willdenowi TaxID=441366 RepID=UPI0010564C6E|nr:uncharacterized protein LOC114468365 isoform X2 [Gouania willdenowi]